jgi:hypothetical protein
MTQKWYKKASVQTAIITGLFLIAGTIIAGLFDLYKLNRQPEETEDHIQNGIIKSEIDTSKSDASKSEFEQYNKYKYLSENQIRVEISKLLKSDNVDKAIELANLLSSNEVKDEEYEHIFNYCIKNEQIEKAEIVVNLYISSDKKDKAQKLIALEKIKKR